MNLTRFEPKQNNEKQEHYYPFTIKTSSERDGGYDISDNEVDCNNEEECFQRYNFYMFLKTLNGRDSMLTKEHFLDVAKELNSIDYSSLNNIQTFKDSLNHKIQANIDVENDNELWDEWITLIEDYTIDISESYNNQDYYFQINSVEAYYNNADGSQVELQLKGK